MNPKDYMRSAISAANKLRTALERNLEGPCTVSPHAGLQGGVVHVYVSDEQADQLTEMVRKHKSPVRQEWMGEFFVHHASGGSGDIVIGHWTDQNNPCPDKWEHFMEGDLNAFLKAAYEHLEVCGK